MHAARPRSSLASLLIALLAASIVALALAPSEGRAGSGDKRTCGTLPGEGAFGYVKTKNVSCRDARKVASKAARKFCSDGRCDGAPDAPVEEGTVRPNGWDCAVKVGYEYYKARCSKGNAKFLYESGA